MADERRDKEIREEIRRAKRGTRRRSGAPRRAAALLLALALALGALGYAAYRGIGGADSLRRRLSYGKAGQSEDGKTERFRFDNDRTAVYAALGDELLIVSTTRILLLDGQGGELFSRTVSFERPAAVCGGQTAAAYDIGGRELYLFNSRGLLRDMSGETGNGILSVSINASDFLALTTLKSGYRAAVSAYDASGAPAFTFNSSERYVSEACVLGDNRHVAAVTLGEADGIFASTLTFYAFDSEKPVSATTLGGSMVLSLGNLGKTLAALEDDRLTLFGADGSLAGSYRFEYPYLRGRSVGSDFAALLLARYRSGSAQRLVTLDGEGNVLGALETQREILDVSAAGRYLAVLYADGLTVCTADLTEYASLADTDFARRVFMRADGTALLIGASRAWLFAP